MKGNETMKLKNNLSKEAYVNAYREQGYNDAQIDALMYSLKYGLSLEKYVTPNVLEDHMDILNEFLANDKDIACYFDADGVLDVASLELDDDIYTRHMLGYY